MNHIYSIISLLLFSNILFSQTQISIDSASTYVGKVVKVCDKVAGTYITKGEKPVTYLNLGADYPYNKLTIVIFQKDLINFPTNPSEHYKSMNVCITGTVKKYKDKLEIIVNKPDQIEVK
jgi:hypothetical protein